MKSLYTVILVLSLLFASCDNTTSTKKSSSSSTQTTEGGETSQAKTVYSFAFATKEHRVARTENSYTQGVVEKHTPPTDKREITYSSSEPKIATVDETTGTVTFKTQGTVIITAEKAAKGAYEQVRDTYTLYITIRPANKQALVDEIDRAMKAHTERVDLNYIDTSAITNMNDLFMADAPKTPRVEGYGLHAFEGDISKWDVSAVINMHGMFYGATAFNSDISGWNVSAVTGMIAMFEGATEFKQNLNDWGSRLNAQIKKHEWNGTIRMFRDSGLARNLPDWCDAERWCKKRQ